MLQLEHSPARIAFSGKSKRHLRLRSGCLHTDFLGCSRGQERCAWVPNTSSQQGQGAGALSNHWSDHRHQVHRSHDENGDQLLKLALNSSLESHHSWEALLDFLTALTG